MTARPVPYAVASSAPPTVIDVRQPHRSYGTVAAAALTALVVGAGVGLSPLVLIGALAVVAVWISFTTPRGIVYLLALVPFGESLGVGPMTIGRMGAVLAVAVLVGKYLTGRLHVPRFPPMTWVPTAGFVAVVVASGLWAASTSGWVFAMGQVGLALAYFAVHALLIDHPSQVEGLLKVYVVGAVFAAGYGFAQAAADLRAEGLQGDANIYALYQVAAVPALLALVKATHGWQRALWALTAIPILYSVVASQSRGALLALIATAIVLAIMSPRRRLLLPLGAVAALVIFTVAPYIDDRYAPERVSADRASGRIDIWFSAWQLFLDHPFTGIGAGNFVGRSIDLLTTTPGVELVKSHLLTGRGIEVHNIYLESLAERGIFGLLTLVVLLLTALAALLIAAQRFRTPAVEALAPMMVAFCVAAFFLSVANSKLLWMLIGVAAALLAIRPTDERPAERPQALTRSIS